MGGPARLGPGDLPAALAGDLTTGRAAEVYAACGFPVVPMHAARPDGGCTCPKGQGCGDPGKHPRLADWPTAASTTPAEVRAWWRRWPAANVGLLCGVGFDVLDIDGPQGVEALRALSDRDPGEHSGAVARTGGGGWHLLFRPTGLGNRVGLRPGLDWRGRGGLIVAPPSVHASGARYRWVRPLRGPLPGVPGGLRRLLAPPPVRPATHPPAVLPAGRGGAWARGALRRERAAVAAAAPGTGNTALNRAAFRLGQLAAAGLLDAEEVRGALLAAACQRGTPEREARATVESGLKGGAAKPRAGVGR